MSTGPVTLSRGDASHGVQDAGLSGSQGDRLRIGLMLRAIDDVDGQGIYIRKLCDSLFEVDRHNQYAAFYSQPSQAGRYRGLANVREVVTIPPKAPLGPGSGAPGSPA